jgi:Transglycosylase-like domain
MRLAMVLVGLAAVIGFSDAPGAPASADPLNSAQATAAQLSQEVLDQAVVVHQLSVRYQTDQAETNYLGAEVASSQRTVDSLRLRSDKTESRLRQEALFSYTDEVPAASAVAQFGGNLVELAARSTYLSLTLGDVTATVLQLQSEQTQLGHALTSLRGEYRNEEATGTQAADQRDRALGEATDLQAMLAQAQSQVAVLTAQQHAQAGLPVGNGIVNAVNQQLGTASPNNRMAADNAIPATTAAVATVPATALPSTTASANTEAVTTVPVTTVPVTTVPVTTVPVTTVPVTIAPAASGSAGASGEPPPAGGVWLELRDCESGDNYQTDTGNGFYGAYQFAGATWSGLGLPGVASDAPYWVQDEAAERLQAQYGWKPWPACSAALGL